MTGDDEEEGLHQETDPARGEEVEGVGEEVVGTAVATEGGAKSWRRPSGRGLPTARVPGSESRPRAARQRAAQEGASRMAGEGGRRAWMRRVAVLILAGVVLVVVVAVRWRLDADPNRVFLTADAAFKAGRYAEADAALRRLERLRPPTSVDRLLRGEVAQAMKRPGPGPGGARGDPRRSTPWRRWRGSGPGRSRSAAGGRGRPRRRSRPR